MTKPNFNESQMRAACAIVHAYGVNHGSTGTDLHHRSAVLGVLAVMIGRLGAVPEIYRHLTKDVELSPGNENLSAGDAVNLPQDAPEGESILVSKEDYDRWNTILSGLSVDAGNMNIAVSPEAAAALREDGSEFPVDGLYIPFNTMQAGLELALAQQAEAIHASYKTEEKPEEPNGDGKADKINFDDMTVEALRAFAEENGVDLGGASKKADIIRTLREFNF